MVQPEPAAPLVGKLIDGRYELLEVIGDGGVGRVYRARRVNLERMVAVKVLHESLVEEPGFVGRFQREAVAMSRLYHPHCVAVIDSGLYDSRPYLVLEYLPGQTIRQLLAEGTLPPARAVDITLQLLETLEYFHSHHVIHRDLKSENVMLVESTGTTDFVKVLDFGMAKILTGPGADSQLSKIGIVPGTPSAMAPEQIYQLPPDPRIDIYATGILLYEMIVGARPFSGPDMATVVRMQISTPPKPPREVLGEHALSAALEQVIMKALEKDRVDRFGTAGEMAAALRATPEGRMHGTAATSGSKWQIGRRAKLLGLGGAAALGLAAVAAVALSPEPVRPDPAHTTTAAAAEPPPPPPPPVAAPAPPPEAPPAWVQHRDRALEHQSRGAHDLAFRALEAAVVADRADAAADPALARIAAAALDRERVPFVIDVFRDNPQLVAALAEATAQGASSAQRQAALAALRELGEESRADPIERQIRDLTEARTCSAIRTAFKRLRAKADPRVRELKAELRARGRSDRHARCLKRMLR